MTDYATLYRESRARITTLVRAASARQRAAVVPGCPDWSVADTVAHLAAVAAEAMDGRLTGIPTEEQTAAQVEQRRGRDIDEVITEWDRVGDAVEQAITTQVMPLAAVHDVLTHEADIRGALTAGRPPRAAWTASLDTMAQHMHHLDQCGTLIVHTGERPYRVGSGTPETTLEVDPYEFWRALVGRRSRAQMAAWRWSGDPAPYLRVLPVFGPTEADLSEPE